MMYSEHEFEKVPWNHNPEKASLQGIAEVKALRNSCDLTDEEVDKIDRIIKEMEDMLHQAYEDTGFKIARKMLWATYVSEAEKRYSGKMTKEFCEKEILGLSDIDI